MLYGELISGTQDLVAEIDKGSVITQSKEVSPSTEKIVVVPDSGYYLSQVLVKPILLEQLNVEKNGVYKPSGEVLGFNQVSVNVIIDAKEGNLEIMKSADLAEITLRGGTLATDEEYEVAYAQFQVLANKIMNGGANG